MKAILLFTNLLLFFIIIKCDTEDQKYYFQLYPSQDKDKPYLFYAYTPPSNFLTINTTEKDNCKIIENSKINESANKNLSSVIMFNNDLVIKTCFNPDILIHIKNKAINEKKSKILSNIKYCYSTAIYSPNIQNNQIEYVIITYWIEYELKDGKEVYFHKCMLYYINSNTFSEEIFLKTTKNFYSERCINFRNKDIFCSIISDEFTSVNYFVIETQKLFKKDNNHLVSSNFKIEKDAYQKIFSGNLGFYDNLRMYFYDLFIIEYHNKSVVNLNFRLYKNSESKALSFEEANFPSSELIIENTYIEPNLFNMLPHKSNDSIVTYIMKAGQKNNYLLSRFNLTQLTKYKNSIQIPSNYLRDDICSNPKYMQSTFMTSFINYNEKEQAYIKKNKNHAYYKYQKDIVSLITCLNKDNKVEYEPKKIVLPQCLNILDELNNLNYHTIEFTPDNDNVNFDISNNPIYRSFRNVGIQFLSPEISNKIIINYKKTNTDKFKAFGGNEFNKLLTSISEITFTKSSKMELNKPITLYYRLTQSVMSEDGSKVSCHLYSDKCELNFIFKEKTSQPIPIPDGSDKVREDEKCPALICDYCDNGICLKCKEIEGIILSKDLKKCICDTRKGFNETPDLINNMCVCKKGYSYYKDRRQCLPDDYLKQCKCLIRIDDLSSIPIYDDCPDGKTILEVDGVCEVIDESYCLDMNNLDMNLWFKLEEYKFYYAKINDCVYIFDDKNLTLFFYSNKEDCAFDSDIMIRFIRNCLNKPEITGVKEYMNFLNSAKEYEPNATNVTIFKKIEKKDSKIKSIFFNLVNGQSQENISDVILPEHIINEIKNISNISEELNLLVFKADITRNDTVSTQVEYQFYNPTPSKIHQKIIFKKNLNYTNSRRLDDNDDDETIIYIKTDDFEVKLNLPMQWTDDELDIIDELYNQKHIFIFNSSDPFYLDVCYKFTTSYNADIYLQDRKEKYYIKHPFCEEECKLIDDHNYETKKLTCQCSLKIIDDNYTNISFYELYPDEKFNKTYYLPNVKVIKCLREIFDEKSILKNAIFYINFFIVVAYCLFYCFKRIICKKNNPFKDIIDTIEKELYDFKTIYLKIPKEEKKDNEENLNNKNDKEHHVDPIKYEEEIKEEKDKIKAYGDDDDFDESKPLKKEKKDQNNYSNESNKPQKRPIKNIQMHEKKNENINNSNNIEKMSLSDNKSRIKNKEKDEKHSKKADLNNDQGLIDENNNDFHNINNEEENNNNINLIDNNESAEENKNKNLIDNNENAKEKKKNNNNLIQDDRKEEEKSFIKKPEEYAYDKDSDKYSNKEFSKFEPSQINDKESENHSIPKESNLNEYKNPLFNSKYSDEKSLDYIASSINNENDQNLQKKANPPKKSKNKNNSIHDKQSESSKSNNTSVNDKNNNDNPMPNIYEGNDKDNLYSNIPLTNSNIINLKDSKVKDLLEHYIFEKIEYSEKIIDRVEYEKALILENDIANKKEILNKNELPNKKDLDKTKEYDNKKGSSGQKKVGRSFCQMFKTMVESNNTIYFVFRCNDKNDCYAKISIGILSAYLYIFINLLIMIKGPSLHLYLRKDNGKFSFLSFIVNLFFPYFIFYFSILKLKKDLSIEEFLNEQYYELYRILCDFTQGKKKEKKSKNNDIEEKDANILTVKVKSKETEKLKEKPKKEENRKKDKNAIINELRLKIHNLETKISKKKNEYQKENQKLFGFGLVLIISTWYFMCCFLEIYENSYDCLILNIAMSALSSLIVSFGVYLISSSFRYWAIKKRRRCLFSISEFFNPQNKYFCCKKICSCCCSCFFFKYISCICSKICCCWYNEKEIEDYIEQVRRKQKQERAKKAIEDANKAKKGKGSEKGKENEKVEKNLKNNDSEDLNGEDLISYSENNNITNNVNIYQNENKKTTNVENKNLDDTY